MLQSGLPLCAEAIVFDIFDIFRVTHPVEVDFCAPGGTKLALVFGVDEPSITINVGVVILILAVITDPATRCFPVAYRLTEPTTLSLMQEPAFLDVSGPVECVVVRREVEINGLGHVDATATVAA